MSRLDDIRDLFYGSNLYLDRDDLDWLIGQAEKFENIKNEIADRLNDARQLDKYDVSFELECLLDGSE